MEQLVIRSEVMVEVATQQGEAKKETEEVKWLAPGKNSISPFHA